MNPTRKDILEQILAWLVIGGWPLGHLWLYSYLVCRFEFWRGWASAALIATHLFVVCLPFIIMAVRSEQRKGSLK